MLKRSYLKRNSSLKRGGPIKRKAKTEEQKIQQQKDIAKMFGLYTEHWDSKPHICALCEGQISGENRSIYHHHVLPKRMNRYKYLMYEIENLQLLCFDCHSKVENGSLSNIEKIEKVKKRFGLL